MSFAGNLMYFSGAVEDFPHECEFGSFKVLEGMVGAKFFSLDGLTVGLRLLFLRFGLLAFLAFVMAIKLFEVGLGIVSGIFFFLVFVLIDIRVQLVVFVNLDDFLAGKDSKVVFFGVIFLL
jgi:hypothetical protein